MANRVEIGGLKIDEGLYCLVRDEIALAKSELRVSVKAGGRQIEYEDQDPRIHRMYVEAAQRHGFTPKMDAFTIPV